MHSIFRCDRISLYAICSVKEPIIEHSIESWKEAYFLDLAVLNSEFFADPEQHVATFLKTKNQSPEFWQSLNNELTDQGLAEDEVNLRLHNVFLATLIQRRRTQIEELHTLVTYEPSAEVTELLSQMNQIDKENQIAV